MKCTFKACIQDAVWRYFEVRNRAIQPGNQTCCEEHAKLLWESYFLENRKGLGQTYDSPGAACFEVDLVMADYKAQRSKVLVREVEAKRLVVFPIGYLEVWVLSYAAQESPYNEFTLHTTLKRVIEHFGGRISHVLIDRFNPAGYFEAKAVIWHAQGELRLRILPSDGLALAILAKVPFLITEDVLATIENRREFNRLDTAVGNRS